MRSKSSLDPYTFLADEANGESNSEQEANDEMIVPNTFDESRRKVPLKKRHCLGRSETHGGEEACVVCDISDHRLSKCAGIDCLLWFHKECMSVDDDSGFTTNPYCSYCWYRILVLKSKPLRDKIVIAEQTMLKYLEVSDDQSRDENTHLSDQQEDLVGEGETSVRVAEESFENEKAQVQSNVDRGSVGLEGPVIDRGAGKGHVSTFSWEEEHDQVVQHKEKQISNSRRRLILNDADTELSSNEHNGEDVVTQQITSSSAQVTTSKATTSTTIRDLSFFLKDKRRRLVWTAEEEDMLKAGVEKFAAQANKNMPWRKILEMGVKVFHETRTSADLKDKWRNMCKKMTH